MLRVLGYCLHIMLCDIMIFVIASKGIGTVLCIPSKRTQDIRE